MFLLIFSNKTGRAHNEKLVKALMEVFWKITILTENPINFDVICIVILSTVTGGGFLFSVPLHLVRKLLSPDSILLKKLGQTLKFEIAIGMNGRIWARANEPKETICIANAIWAAEHMTNNEIKPMVDRLSDALAGF